MTEPLHLTGEIVERAQGDPGDGRTIRIRMVRWDTPSPTPEGYRESFAKGAFKGVDATRVTVESQRHGGTLVGRGTAIDEADDAGYLEARVARTPAGDELLTLIDEGVLREASVAYQPVPGGTVSDGDIVTRQRVDLWRVAVVERGVHQGAGVVAVRSRDGGSEMTEQTAPDVREDPDQTLMRAMAPMLERMSSIDSRLDAVATLAAIPQLATPAPGADAGSLGELLLRAWEGEGGKLIARALLDQVTTANAPLVSGRSFIDEAVGIVRASRPSVEAFGGARSLPESGMSVEWPVAVPPASEPIAKQTAEKTEIHSVLVSFTSANAPIATYAGGSDISIQLLRRSSPSYRDLYARTMLGSYAKVTNAAFSAAVALAASGSVIWDPATGTADTFTAALFEASLEVQEITGQPATFALVARDIFLKLGASLKPTNPQNANGTGNAAGLNVNISGIDIIPDLSLAAGTALISNRQTASWLEDGPNVLEATDVAKLGQNVAYWGLGVPAVTVPAGIIELAAVAGRRTAAAKS